MATSCEHDLALAGADSPASFLCDRLQLKKTDSLAPNAGCALMYRWQSDFG
jgi:hypothetical protein